MTEIKPHPTEIEIKKCRRNIATIEKQIRQAELLAGYYRRRIEWNLRKQEEIERFFGN